LLSTPRHAGTRSNPLFSILAVQTLVMPAWMQPKKELTAEHVKEKQSTFWTNCANDSVAAMHFHVFVRFGNLTT
jgi:hypothetical protein